jgi:hypothetical protein
MKERGHMQPSVQLLLTIVDDLLPRFCVLAGSGFTMAVRTGCSLQDLLCGQCGVPSAYLKRRIQTIFLDGSVVDDPHVALQVRPRSQASG